jgi:rare lipoprotein A
MIKLITVISLFAIATGAHAEVASIYGGRDGLCGSRTASGERFNCAAMTAAMLSTKERPIPFGTWVRVTHAGRSVAVRISDRGPFVKNRAIDLSPAAGKRIGCAGVCEVQIERIERPYVPESGFGRGTF